MRFMVRRGRKPSIGIGIGVISVRGGYQGHQRAKRKRQLRHALQQARHAESFPHGAMLSRQIARINYRLALLIRPGVAALHQAGAQLVELAM